MSTAQTAPVSAVKSALLLLVHSNLLISLSATAVAVSTVVLADLRLDPVPLFIVFAVTLFVYSFNRLTDIAEDAQNVPNRAVFVEQYGTLLLAIGVVLYLLATVIAFVARVPAVPAMVAPLVVAVLYSVVGVKRVLLVKNLLVGLSWGAIPLGVGVYYGRLFTLDILVTFAFITAALTIAAVVFDIKDIQGDSVEGIATVPLVVGVERTKRLAAIGCVGLGLTVLALVAVGPLHRQYLLLIPFSGYMAIYSLLARVDRTPLFYGFVIDSEHIFLAVALYGTDILL